jgi:hypothetical protein
LALYRDPNIDVLWVIGHGNQVAFAPDENSLQVLAGDEGIPVTTLAGQSPARSSRRLLVLNLCNGAKPTGYASGLPRMSMAGLCASESQAVIAHLWPVEVFAAYAFGLTLAGMLSSGHSYFSSYCRTVKSLQGGNENIATKLRDAGLAQHAVRVEAGASLENPIRSYSAAFYE